MTDFFRGMAKGACGLVVCGMAWQDGCLPMLLLSSKGQKIHPKSAAWYGGICPLNCTARYGFGLLQQVFYCPMCVLCCCSIVTGNDEKKWYLAKLV